MPSSRLVVRSLLPLPLFASLLALSPSRGSSHRPVDLLVLSSRETGRAGLAALLASYPAPATPGMLEEGVFYDLYLDSDRDGREDTTFRFRGEGPSYQVEMLFGPAGKRQASSLLTRHDDAAPSFEAGVAAGAEIPGCGTGRVYVGPVRTPVKAIGTLVALELPEECLSAPGGGPALVSAGVVVAGGRQTMARIPARPRRAADAIAHAFPYLPAEPRERAAKASCCGNSPYICYRYAMIRAGFTPTQNCPTAIVGTEFGTISLSLLPQANIVTWGDHAGYIISSTANTITTDEFNRLGSCAVSPNSHTYSSSQSWGDGDTGPASFAYVRRPGAVPLSSPANGATGIGPTVTLSWGTDAAGLSDAYWVDRTTDSSFATYTREQVSSTSITRTLAANTTYYWRVYGLQGPYGGQYVESKATPQVRWFKTAPPCAAITVPWISAASYQGHPQITWTAASGADKYKIYKRTGDATGTFFLAAEVTGTSWHDPNELLWTYPPALKVYKYYKIKAVNNGPGCNPPYETGFSNYQYFTCNQPELQ